MVEIEEITDEQEERPPPPKGYKYKKTKKDLPSVSHLLAHGSDESKGKPKTLMGECWYPIFIAVCFAISLLIFHYAPHDKSVQPKGKFAMQYKQRQYEQKMQREYQARQQQAMDMGTEVPLPPTTMNHMEEEVKPQQQGGGGSGSSVGEL